jgi:hypothetical protein
VGLETQYGGQLAEGSGASVDPGLKWEKPAESDAIGDGGGLVNKSQDLSDGH